jgi:hypothetical protein
MKSLTPCARQIDLTQYGGANHTDRSECEDDRVNTRLAHLHYFASGSGRS